MAKIIMVEDDLNISRTVKSWLENEKYVVDAAATGNDGLELLLHFDYDLAILDWQLPDLQGPDIARKLQENGKNIPILMLTSKGELQNKIEGLEAGAFDYVVKPCSLEELSARVRALLRRTIESGNASTLSLGSLEMRLIAREVFASGNEVKLSPSEFEILKLMLKSPGASFSTDAIFARLWSDKPNVSKQLVKVHVNNLRKKLAAAQSSVQVLTNDLLEYCLKDGA